MKPRKVRYIVFRFWFCGLMLQINKHIHRAAIDVNTETGQPKTWSAAKELFWACVLLHYIVFAGNNLLQQPLRVTRINHFLWLITRITHTFCVSMLFDIAVFSVPNRLMSHLQILQCARHSPIKRRSMPSNLLPYRFETNVLAHFNISEIQIYPYQKQKVYVQCNM